MTRYKIATTDEFDGDGTRVLVEVDGLEIAVFRVDGEYHALANYCVHQGGPLCEGKLTGRMSVGDDGVSWEYDGDQRYVVCPWHEWKFDVTTGRNVSDERYVTPTFEVTVEGEDVYVVR
jgi:nitrite reductase/ring-hydroxylating ferredoxin subunit